VHAEGEALALEANAVDAGERGAKLVFDARYAGGDAQALLVLEAQLRPGDVEAVAAGIAELDAGEGLTEEQADERYKGLLQPR